MCNLLITDDEDIIRAGLRTILENMDLGIDGIWEAQDGETAFSLYLAKRPDILLVDIKMPGMSGIELIRKIRENDNQVRIIILTGYSEFEYAREAVQNKVFHYLLKPVRRNELEEVLRRAVADIEEEAAKKQLQQERENTVSKLVSELNERKLVEFFNGNVDGRHTFIELAASVGFAAKKPCWIPLICEMLASSRSFALEGFEYMADKLKRMMVQQIDGILVFRYNEACLGAVVNCDPSFSAAALKKKIDDIMASRVNFDIDTVWGIGPLLDDVSHLRKGFRMAVACRMDKILYGGARVYTAEAIEKQYHTVQISEVEISRMLHLAGHGEKKELQHYISGKFDEAVESKALSAKQYVDALCRMLLEAASHFKGAEEAEGFFHEEINRFVCQLEFCQGYAETVKLAVDSLIGIGRRTVHETAGKSGRNQAVEFAKSFILQNFHRDLSLDMIANQVSMNPSYFSVLFKREEGKSLVDFINDIRIGKSMQYLKDPQYRMYEVAEKAGFRNEKYFSSVFKKFTGMTPKEYREKQS